MGNTDYQDKVKHERDELMTKIIAIDNFFETDIFKELSGEDQDLMRDQGYYMMCYLENLNKQINNFLRQ